MYEKEESGTLKYFAAALVAFAIVAGAVWFFGSKKQQKEVEEHNRAVLQVDTVSASYQNLPGTYSILVDNAGAETRYTGVIEEDALGNYVLRIYDEYEPRTVLLTVTDDGTLESEELGKGTMTYKKNIDKTTLTFIKEDSKCTLTK